MLITPEYVFKDVTHITPEWLAQKAIRALVLDIDNTLTADRSQELPDEVAGWLAQMKEAGIGYGAINHPIDRDPVCGYTGIIGEVCPRCGRREGEAVSPERIKELRKLYPGTFTLSKKSAAKTSSWAESDVNLALNDDLLDTALLGDPAEEADRQPNTLKIVKK